MSHEGSSFAPSERCHSIFIESISAVNIAHETPRVHFTVYSESWSSEKGNWTQDLELAPDASLSCIRLLQV